MRGTHLGTNTGVKLASSDEEDEEFKEIHDSTESEGSQHHSKNEFDVENGKNIFRELKYIFDDIVSILIKELNNYTKTIERNCRNESVVLHFRTIFELQ